MRNNMEKDKKYTFTPNKGKCIFKHLNIGCTERLKCNGFQKKGCKLSKISNTKST